MNERIKELLQQSGVTVTNGLLIGVASMDTELFAELIVKECAELCSDLDGGENMFSRGIRKHFGVE